MLNVILDKYSGDYLRATDWVVAGINRLPSAIDGVGDAYAIPTVCSI